MDGKNETGLLKPKIVDRRAVFGFLVELLESLDSIQRGFFPGLFSNIRERLQILTVPLQDCLEKLQGERDGNISRDLATLQRSVEELAAMEDMNESILQFWKIVRKSNRLKESIYSIRHEFDEVNLYFLERVAKDSCLTQGPERGGIMHIGITDQDPYARGALSLYIPERWDGKRPMPLVMALHGGFGHGRDFIWTWFREARSREFLLVAPTSRQATWSITGPDMDVTTIEQALREVRERAAVDDSRMLLTGMSDGATYALKRCLDSSTPFAAFAPVSGLLPPFSLEHARGRRIFWIHGSMDWVFPLWYAKAGLRQLRDAGADIIQEIVPDLYHAYPRERNGDILAWFDSGLKIV